MSGMLVARIVDNYSISRKFNGGFGLNRRLSIIAGYFGKSHKLKVNLAVCGCLINPIIGGEVEGYYYVLSPDILIKVADYIDNTAGGSGSTCVIDFESAYFSQVNGVGTIGYRKFLGGSYHNGVVTIEGNGQAVKAAH